ncbi:unnamed protein product [Cylindrotheca closterium]|uniref:Uncharacterized protein n=1 Tax=Cylindrotheca closterium TaxID=2856 RepID=A0AAD2FFH7_9STRA|nr:unnamed protein product [Cylindrotheca closterium]
MSLSTTNLFVRNGLAVVGGLAVGSAINMGLITLNSKYLFPMPPDVSFDDEEKFGDYIKSLPPLAYTVVFCAHYGQAIVGGILASKLASSDGGEGSGDLCCYIVGGLTMIGSIMNTVALPVPAWTWLEIPVFPFLIYYTAKMASGKSDKKAE